MVLPGIDVECELYKMNDFNENCVWQCSIEEVVYGLQLKQN